MLRKNSKKEEVGVSLGVFLYSTPKTPLNQTSDISVCTQSFSSENSWKQWETTWKCCKSKLQWTAEDEVCSYYRSRHWCVYLSCLVDCDVKRKFVKHTPFMLFPCTLLNVALSSLNLLRLCYKTNLPKIWPLAVPTPEENPIPKWMHLHTPAHALRRIQAASILLAIKGVEGRNEACVSKPR